MIAEDPLTAVAIGTGKFIEFAHGMTSALEASMGIGGGKERDDYLSFINHRRTRISAGFFLSPVPIRGQNPYRSKRRYPYYGNHHRIY